jgi:DNA-binding IclR family transcriptional regulator
MPGQVLPVLRSSAGQLYAAFLPKAFTTELVDRELAAIGAHGDNARKLLERIDEVSRQRHARSVGEAESHLQSISVPVFDWHDNWLVTVGCVFDVDTDVAVVNDQLAILRGFAEKHSITPKVSMSAVV